jgi:hypothetical protein
MSVKGVKATAKVFEQMQLARQRLLNMGSKNVGTKSAQQDLLLGQLLQQAEDSVKTQFMKLTMMKVE